MDMAMASSEPVARPNAYGGPSGNAPQGSNPMPNNQTPGHPSFRRCVAGARLPAWKYISLTRRCKDNVRRELVRYEAIPFLLYSLWSKRASAPRIECK
jgi:hypothetical protein